MSSENINISDDEIDLNKLSNDELIALRKKTIHNRCEHYRLYNELYHEIQHIEKVLYNKCDHEWELDYSGAGPHDGPDRICKKCNLYQ